MYPTSYGAQHSDIEWLIDRDRILDPSQYFIIIPNMFGNALSFSPSNNTACGLAETEFYFTHLDNIRAQKQSIWGHRAGNPYQNPEDERFVKEAVEELLKR